MFIFIQETEVKNEVQDCPENDSVPGGELYIDENAEEKEQEYPDPMEKADYGALYGANQYYNRYLNIKSPDTHSPAIKRIENNFILKNYWWKDILFARENLK